MWIKLIPLVLGIIFLVVSMVIKYNVELRRTICIEQVSAIVAGVTKHNIYTPVYNYVYGGSEYNVSGIFTCRARIGSITSRKHHDLHSRLGIRRLRIRHMLPSI